MWNGSSSAELEVKESDQRLTRRIRVHIPLLVYGYTFDRTPFSEEASTLEINAQGALIVMKTAVVLNDRMLLTNETNNETLECTVRAVTARCGQDLKVAVAFPAAAAQFWRKAATLREIYGGQRLL